MSEDNFDDQFEDDENLDEGFEDGFEEDSGEDFEDEDFEDDFEEGTAGEEYDGSDQGDDDEEEEDFDKPVSEGDTVEVEIEDLGSKGDGIARVEGFVVFVPGGEVGESYDVEVTSVGRKFAFAEIAE